MAERTGPSIETEGGGLSVVIQHPSLSIPPDRCRRLLERVLAAEGVPLRRLSVVLADHSTVLELNRRFLEHDYHTDVLAFNYDETGDAVEGEIFVDLDTALERHAEFDAGFEEEALRYAVHGLLHLLGYSDETSEGETEMHRLEDHYLDVERS